ncbi:MAG: hypothetical protein V3S61_03375 [Dehalococcoidales bacterium]
MTPELGKIEKPEAGQYRDRKKLYLVFLIFSWPDAPKEYKDKFDLYWQQVTDQLSGLEAKIGPVNYLYHESITRPGEEGLKTLAKLSPASFNIIDERHKQGAKFETVEGEELLKESMDWERLLLAGFLSQKVADIVSNGFIAATKARYEHIITRITETLKEGEAGVLFIREEHTAQFPDELEIFSVMPPALDDIHRWLREQSAKPPEIAEKGKTRKKKP